MLDSFPRDLNDKLSKSITFSATVSVYVFIYPLYFLDHAQYRRYQISLNLSSGAVVLDDKHQID